MLRTVWNATLAPLLRRPARFQVAALCYRRAAHGPEVLMITSRDTGRWILPKGWPISGHDARGSACAEAWEEAGVGPAPEKPLKIGQYRYDKRLKGGVPVATEVHVFAMEVAELRDSYPEMSLRKRRWMTPAEAAEAVDEPELKDLLLNLPPEIGG